MSKDYKTVTSFELCPDLGFDSYISPALKEQHSEFANQCTGRQRIEATWPKWKGHLRVNVCSTLAKCGDPWWSSSFNTHGTFENVQLLHQGRWEKHVVSCSSCMKISTLLTAGWCIVKPCEKTLQSANDHRFVWCSFSKFRKTHELWKLHWTWNFIHSRFHFWGKDQLCAVQRQIIQAKDGMGYGSKLPSSEIDVRLAENGSKYVEIIFNLDNYTGNPQV